jgi:putative transposase
MDFVHDQRTDARRFRILTVIDRWSRESLSLESGFSLTGKDVAEALQRLPGRRAVPRRLPSHRRPHGSLSHLTPSEFANRRQINLPSQCPARL